MARYVVVVIYYINETVLCTKKYLKRTNTQIYHHHHQVPLYRHHNTFTKTLQCCEIKCTPSLFVSLITFTNTSAHFGRLFHLFTLVYIYILVYKHCSCV